MSSGRPLLGVALLLLAGFVTPILFLLHASAARGPEVAPSRRCEPVSTQGTTQTSGGGGLMVGAGLRELTGRSARVVVGTVESFQTCVHPEEGFLTTVTIATSRHLKSPILEAASPSQVTIDVRGGRLGSYVLGVGSSPDFTVGERVVVFLRRVDGGRLRLTAEFQGKFAVSAADEVARVNLPLAAFEAKVRQTVRGALPASEDPLATSAGQFVELVGAFVTFDARWFAEDIPVGYFLNSDTGRPAGLTGVAVQTAWNNAFNTWENDVKSSIDFTLQGKTARVSGADVCGPPDFFNDLTWGIAGAHDPSTLAVAISCAEVLPGTDRIRDADTEFDTDHFGAAWRTDGSGSCGSGLFDLETVALHEAGHFIGLDHPSANACTFGQNSECPIMDATYGGVQRSLCQDDANGAAFHYPPSGPTSTPTPTPTRTITPTITPTKQPEPGDTDGDGCSDQRENGSDPLLGGLRNYKNPNDFFDVFGQGLNPVKDKKIDVPNDILQVILAYGDGPNDPGGGVNPAQYSTAKDRGPAVVGALYSWQRTGPDGKVDVPNDLLPIILQYNHSCV